ncbi:hypothetical protein [Amycolatopsis sp.]|uniref:hypothetical protein n=1 Tax=Amycolatopsis sp. TaxID=37632 RepID=UPI002D7FFD52|nr:hypothetical protein [Amycolatopsis sp.]HET6705573.1 hypothetical protein [Amycolatopsis sp.]
MADLGTAVNTAVALGAKYVSNSYGGGEDGSEPGHDTSYFHHPGVAITASTGDNGYGISYPASSQYVTAVGGTSLTQGGGTRGWTETAWSGAGSGCSTSVAVYGGTSASAPIIASVYALAGTPGASDTPAAYPYSHAGNLNDVTSGSKGSCSTTVQCKAGAGWDGPTGLGTPNGTATFTAGTSSGGVTAANPGSQSGVTGTATGLTISAAGLISGTPATAGTYSVTAKDSSGATGSTTFPWTITAPGGSGCTGQKLANPGFESGATSWTASGGVITTTTSSEAAHSGSYLAYLDGYGSAHTDTLSQPVTIPAGCHATLSYYLHIDTAETTTSTQYDKLTVKAGSTTLATYSNLDKATGYQQRTVDVSASPARR